MCSTSMAGFQFALQLKEQHEKQLEVQKNQNKTDLPEIAKDSDSKRHVGEIDYAKHEQTIKNLEREEELAEREEKARDAATWCPLDHEHGPNCIRPRGDCSHNHQKEIAIYERPTEDKIKAAKQFREAGNKLYKEENYGLAAVEYRKGLLQYDYTFPEGDEEIFAVDNAKLALHLNMAACKIQLDDYNEALIHCRCACQIDPNSCKALYRRGIALMGKLEFSEAKTSFLEALDVEPHNAAVHTALMELKAKIVEYEAKTKKVASCAINALHDSDDEELADETAAERNARGELEEMEGISMIDVNSQARIDTENNHSENSLASSSSIIDEEDWVIEDIPNGARDRTMHDGTTDGNELRRRRGSGDEDTTKETLAETAPKTPAKLIRTCRAQHMVDE
eukprot:GEMP01053253.1.p1 GENE.GEMP01053253.1~~GEMP01053253.1.p1  ORF type:complete len:395 (+),score=90.24 GEMP01053253.1:51-1235(+)